jgi:hypothetical protein
MLATSGALPEDYERWAFEAKWDGFRAIVHVDSRAVVWSRRGTDLTERFPEVAELASAVPPDKVLDGELVAFDSSAVRTSRAAARSTGGDDGATSAPEGEPNALVGDSSVSESPTSDLDGRVYGMAANPFHYGTPVEGDQFTGRERELDALLGRMQDGINVVLMSPRRYGKSSLLLRAEDQLSELDPPAAIVKANVLRSRDLAALVGQLTASAYQVQGGRWHRARQAVPEFLRRLRLRPSVTFDDQGKPKFSFEAGLAPSDADDVIADLYALLADEAKSRPATMVLDEFQAVSDLGAHLPDLLKGLADSHPKVSLVVAGSRRHLMERLVTSEGAPLYGMAQKIVLGPIPDDVMARFLIARSRAGGKPMNEATASLILELARPVPNDIQHLAYESFEVAARRIGPDAVHRGLGQAVAHEASLYAELFAARPPGQRRVLVALAGGSPHPTFSAAFARSVGLAGSNSVKKALDALSADELVTVTGGHHSVSDPFFAAWLRESPA